MLLAVLRGDVEQGRLRVRVGRGFKRRTIVAGPPIALTVADPFGANPWRLARLPGARNEACVRWMRVRRFTVRGEPLARGARHCGDADDTIAVAEADRAGGRLIISGLVDDDVRSVSLRGAGAPRRVALDRGTGGFLAVLPGDVDAADLSVVATQRGGRQVARPPAIAR